MNPIYSLVSSKENELVAVWLKNGVIALGIARIYSIILVILRTPVLNKFISNSEIFKSALIIHFNLSILVWLMSISAAIWSTSVKYFGFAKLCSQLSLISTLIMGISPLFGQTPIMNNYIPILENIVFIIGLSLFGIVMLLFAFSVLLKIPSLNELQNCDLRILTQTNALSTSIMFIGVWCCFVLSQRELQQIVMLVPIDIEFYYELLFLSGGHLLQFIYTQILMIVWILLFTAWLKEELKYKKLYLLLLILNFLLSLGAFLGHLKYDIIAGEFKEYYTSHMKYVGGIAPILCVSGLVFEAVFLTKENRLFIKASIICSSILFLSGGLIGILISGMNVTIPAHYHGAVVGISIAFMGFAYLYVFSEKTQEDMRMSMKYAAIQLYILTFGQILHISGLAIAGGYEALRKSTDMILPLKAKIALGLMGAGGLIAIIGGLMFVVICGRKLFYKK